MGSSPTSGSLGKLAIPRGGSPTKREIDETDAASALIAHALLNSVAIIAGAAGTLRSVWQTLDDERRETLLSMIESQAAHVAGVLQDLVRGLPVDALDALQHLADESPGGGRLP